MVAVLEKNAFEDEDIDPMCPSVVVVGTGPVGIHFVEEFMKRSPEAPVVIYGREPWEPYNRVRLAGLLTGEIDFDGIQNPIKLAQHHNVIQHHHCEIVAIDTDKKRVYDSYGRYQTYYKLILATGSRPHIPSIEGIDQSGIYTFRDLDDVQKLMARRTRSRNTVVLGGGLLGLEAARGLQKYHTDVTVIEHSTHLMTQQLDDRAGSMLREHLFSYGIKSVLRDSVKRVLGDGRIKGIELRSGRIIDCDTMVIATGIRPNIELARNAYLAVGRGIRVNDQMLTSNDDIYAIGECAEHRGRIYGLVAPGREQASVLAHHLSGGKSQYIGSQTATRLKVAGVSVFNAGRTGETEVSSLMRTVTWRSMDNTRYRKLVLLRNRLVGAIAFGDWDETRRVQESVQRKTFVWPWHLRRFTRMGRIWTSEEATKVIDWPGNAVVCQCANVRRSTLSQAISNGHNTIESLQKYTGASSVCGSCKPLLAELVGCQAITPEEGSRTLSMTGIVSLLAVMCIVYSPDIPFADSVRTTINWDLLWRDGLVKQISGFTLFGLGVVVSLISLRKRIKRVTAGKFSSWRIFHVVLGMFAVVTLVAHTGFRFGHYLNLYLMISFVGLILAGAAASVAIGLQHALPRAVIKSVRELSLWSHILLLWPLPALLGFHILKSYWF